MQEYFIVTGTVTYAIRAKEILRKNGFYARVEKISSSENDIGCGYAVAVKEKPNEAAELLVSKGIKILKIKSKNS